MVCLLLPSLFQILSNIFYDRKTYQLFLQRALNGGRPLSITICTGKNVGIIMFYGVIDIGLITIYVNKVMMVVRGREGSRAKI